MGNCRSQPREKRLHTDHALLRSTSVSKASVSSLVHSFFAIGQPIIRRAISKRLIEQVGVLRDEIPVEKWDDEMTDAELPLKPLSIQFEDVHVVTTEELRDDMNEWPNFQWPERDRYEELMRCERADQSVDMLVLDLIKFEGELRFDQGVEVTLPVKGPFGTRLELEIGYGGGIDEGWVRISVPKLRIWYNNREKKMYLAFMARPDLVPCLNVNVDRGRGDFLSVNFTEEGALDDIVENVLASFGPKHKSKPDLKSSFVGDKVGKLLVTALSKFKNIGNGKPFEINLENSINGTINKAMGNTTRPVEDIKADIMKLEAELKQAEERESSKNEWKERIKLHTEQDEVRSGLMCGLSDLDYRLC